MYAYTKPYTHSKHTRNTCVFKRIDHISNVSHSECSFSDLLITHFVQPKNSTHFDHSFCVYSFGSIENNQILQLINHSFLWKVLLVQLNHCTSSNVSHLLFRPICVITYSIQNKSVVFIKIQLNEIYGWSLCDIFVKALQTKRDLENPSACCDLFLSMR